MFRIALVLIVCLVALIAFTDRAEAHGPQAVVLSNGQVVFLDAGFSYGFGPRAFAFDTRPTPFRPFVGRVPRRCR